MQFKFIAITAAGLGWILFAAPRARADDPSLVVPPGAQAKMSAGAGQTVSRGGTALFYNPGNLVSGKFLEIETDISYMQATYTYQNINSDKFAPAVAKVAAPPVTLGAAIRPMPRLAFGLAILPTGTGQAQTISQVPIELIPGTYTAMNVSNAFTGMKVAAGAAYRIAPAFTAGFGLIHSSEKTHLTAAPDNTDPVIDALYQNSSNQYILGIRSEILDRKLVLGLSYKTSVTKNYAGDVIMNVPGTDATDNPFTGVGYDPAAIGFGAEARIGRVSAFLDVLHVMWSGGRSVVKKGLSGSANEPAEVDFVDTNNIAVGGKLWFGKTHMLEAAFAMVGANIGNGTEEPDPSASSSTTSTDPVIGGVGYGDIGAIARQIIAGGYRYRLKKHGYFEAGAQYQKGSRSVPEGYNYAGTFTFTAMMMTLGFTYGF